MSVGLYNLLSGRIWYDEGRFGAVGGSNFALDSNEDEGARAFDNGSGGVGIVLYLEVITFELPRIFCALKGLMCSSFSLSKSAVDLMLGCLDNDILDRNEGGLWALGCASVLTRGRGKLSRGP